MAPFVLTVVSVCIYIVCVWGGEGSAIMGNLDSIPSGRPLGYVLQNWDVFSHKSTEKKKMKQSNVGSRLKVGQAKGTPTGPPQHLRTSNKPILLALVGKVLKARMQKSQ